MWLSLFTVCLAIAICLSVAATINAINNRYCTGCLDWLTQAAEIWPSSVGRRLERR